MKNALLSLASVAVCLALLAGTEIGLRSLDPQYLNRVFGEEASTVYSEVYGWDLRKGFHGVSFGDIQTINRLGYRGREHPHEKEAGRTRIVILGDSVAFGAGVKDEETFSALMEARDPRLEVVNLSVGGYGTDQELLKLEHEGLAYHPDVVLLHFCLFSDFVDNSLAVSLWDSRQPKPYFKWDGSTLVEHGEHVRLSPVRRLAQHLSEYSHLYNRVRSALGLRPAPAERGVAQARMKAVRKRLVPTVDLTFRLIQRMNQLAREAGARFCVVIDPDEEAFLGPSRLEKAFCHDPLLEGIPVVDMGDRYRAARLSFDDVSLDSVGHLTRLGHQMMAKANETIVAGAAPPDWDFQATCSTRYP